MYRLLQTRLLRHSGVPAALALALILSLLITGCSKRPPSPATDEKRYEMTGVVVSVEPDENQVTVRHDEIKGFMGAMTMPFHIRDREALAEMRPGDQIQATLVVSLGRSWLENPSISRPSDGSQPSNTAVREAVAGDEVPNVNLVDQEGSAFDLGRYRDRILMVSFIYTRCPLPDYCPLTNRKFSDVNNLIDDGPAELRDAVSLLSVTIDPEFDTPAVLKAFRESQPKGKSPHAYRRWTFATGSPEEIRRFASFFGLTYEGSGIQITHSLRTAIIDRHGKVYKIYRGNDWTPEDAMADMASLIRSNRADGATGKDGHHSDHP